MTVYEVTENQRIRDQLRAVPGEARQFSVSFRLVSGVDARHWRSVAYDCGIAGVGILDALRFSGSKASLNVTAIRPEGNAFESRVGAFAQIIATDTGSFVPVNLSSHRLSVAISRPLAYRISSLVLRKSGEKWDVAKDAAWQTEYIERKFCEGVATQAMAWGIRAPALNCKVAQLGDVLAVHNAIRTGRTRGAANSVLILRSVDLFVDARFTGCWSVGPLQVSGMGSVMARPMAGMVMDREIQEVLLA